MSAEIVVIVVETIVVVVLMMKLVWTNVYKKIRFILESLVHVSTFSI